MSMHLRERVISSMKHQTPDIIPAYVRKILGWEKHASYFGVQSLDELMQQLGNTIISFVPTYTVAGKESVPEKQSTSLPNIWGVAKDNIATYTDTVYRPLADADNVADIEAYPWPSGDESSWDFTGMRTNLMSEKNLARLSPSWMPVFSRLLELFGMEQAMLNIHLNRPVIEAALAHIDIFYSEFYQNMLEICGDQLEIFGLGDDFAGNRGLLINPDLWRKMFKPLYAKWIDMAKNHGLLTMMHSCGKIVDVLPDLIDIGLDAWQTVQAHLPGQEADRIKNEFGNYLTFVGAIDTTNVLGGASTLEVRKHVQEKILSLGKGGGYICAPDHIIIEEVPSENIEALYDTIAEFRSPGYTSLP